MPRWYAGGDTARRSYYDRDPIPVFASYNTIVAPHGFTIRASYSPPTDFAAFIESISSSWVRQAVAGTAGATSIYVLFNPYYGGSHRLVYLMGLSNTYAVQYTHQVSSLGYMAYGDTIQVGTADGSTGGNIEFSIVVKGTEFLY